MKWLVKLIIGVVIFIVEGLLISFAFLFKNFWIWGLPNIVVGGIGLFMLLVILYFKKQERQIKAFSDEKQRNLELEYDDAVKICFKLVKKNFDDFIRNPIHNGKWIGEKGSPDRNFILSYYGEAEYAKGYWYYCFLNLNHIQSKSIFRNKGKLDKEEKLDIMKGLALNPPTDVTIEYGSRFDPESGIERPTTKVKKQSVYQKAKEDEEAQKEEGKMIG